jgi:hypothetical protein
MYVNYPKRPNKITFEFPKLNVATTYAVTDQLISYFTKYYYETGNPYFELHEVANGKYVLSVCTFAPVKNLRSFIKVQVDGKVLALKAMPKME